MSPPSGIKTITTNINKEKNAFRVLGIETSCDDTGVAIIDNNGNILSNCVHSQLKEHLDNGGIIPRLAKEYHLDNIDRVAQRAFRESKLNSINQDIDAIAVTTRPGLSHSLQVGLNYARTLAKKYSKPLIPIHHMQAHALMPLLEHKQAIRFPFLALLISGGHCIISIAKRQDEFHILGNTLDIAPGDLLDKFARRLNLRNLGPPFNSISGGAAIELLSKRQDADRFKYFTESSVAPRAPNCNFAFSGYRKVLDDVAPEMDKLWLESDREVLNSELSHICASLQRAMLVQFTKRLSRAVLFYRMYWRYENEDAFAQDDKDEHLGFRLQKINDDDEHDCIDLVVSGGVAANAYFLDGFKLACQKGFHEPNMKVYAPSRSLCSDNGLMVAWNGLLRYSDFLVSGKMGRKCDSEYCDSGDLDQIQVEATSLMGEDLSDQVFQKRITIGRMSHPEFKLRDESQ